MIKKNVDYLVWQWQTAATDNTALGVGCMISCIVDLVLAGMLLFCVGALAREWREYFNLKCFLSHKWKTVRGWSYSDHLRAVVPRSITYCKRCGVRKRK